MKNILKTMVTLTLLIVALSACQQQKDVSTLLEKDDTRNEIFNTIISDHEYAEQLITKMMEDDHTKMMMKGNQEMMGMMMSENEDMTAMMKDNPEMMHGMMSNMMNMAEADSSMCAHLMTMMKDKPNMMGQMMEMMHKEGIMDKETMMRNKEKMGKENHPGHH
ncbi:MAG: hypothetical protein CMO01_24080 [Thalassobius sp.]|jgi:hypothetical protein|nr:hypothetical protein [Thalassovita sp.]